MLQAVKHQSLFWLLMTNFIVLVAMLNQLFYFPFLSFIHLMVTDINIKHTFLKSMNLFRVK